MNRVLINGLTVALAIGVLVGCDRESSHNASDTKCYGNAVCVHLSASWLTQSCSNGQMVAKLTAVSVRWTQQDPQFAITRFDGRMGQVGITCDSRPIVDGQPITVSMPVKNQTYSFAAPNYPFVTAHGAEFDFTGANVQARVRRGAVDQWASICVSAYYQAQSC